MELLMALVLLVLTVKILYLALLQPLVVVVVVVALLPPELQVDLAVLVAVEEVKIIMVAHGLVEAELVDKVTTVDTEIRIMEAPGAAGAEEEREPLARLVMFQVMEATVLLIPSLVVQLHMVVVVVVAHITALLDQVVLVVVE